MGARSPVDGQGLPASPYLNVMTATGLHPRLESEAAFESWFTDFMRLHRWDIRHVSDSRKQAGGSLVGDADAADLPDWLCVRERVVFVELKGWQRRGNGMRQGQPTDGQLQFMTALHDAGAEVYLFWPEDRDEIERVLA